MDINVPEDDNTESLRQLDRKLEGDPRWEHGYILTPGRYVGAEEVEGDGVPFEENMATLTTQFVEFAKLDKAIRENMKALGFDLPAIVEPR
jgi:hypothetical protein